MNPQDTTYSQLQNLIQSAEQRGKQLSCVFECPVSGKTAQARVDIVKANDSVTTKVKSKLRDSAIKSTTRSLTKGLRSLFGSNVVSRIAGDLVKDQAKAVSNQGGFSQGELECATLRAFEQVRRQFVWDESRCGFVHQSVVGEVA